MLKLIEGSGEGATDRKAEILEAIAKADLDGAVFVLPSTGQVLIANGDTYQACVVLYRAHLALATGNE